MGLVKTRRLAAMQKQQKAKAVMKLPMPKNNLKTVTRKEANHAQTKLLLSGKGRTPQ